MEKNVTDVENVKAVIMKSVSSGGFVNNKPKFDV